MRQVRVVCYGVGVIGGLLATNIIQNKSWISIVGAIDADPAKVGKDLKDMIRLEKSTGVKVSSDVRKVISETKPDLVLHTTSSSLSKIFPQLKEVIELRTSIVSSCEELSYPWSQQKELAVSLDKLAKENKVAVVGTGINPGFVMDALPIVLTSPCLALHGISVTRQMDAATRRIPFQKKIGVGLTSEQHSASLRTGMVTGHVGLRESIAMVADSVGWTLDRIDVGSPEAVIAERTLESGLGTLRPGDVAGTSQSADGIVGGKPVIKYRFRAYVGAKEEFDLVEIEGRPSFSVKTTPCVNGDSGTLGMLINTIPKILGASPGLHTMKDLVLPSYVG